MKLISISGEREVFGTNAAMKLLLKKAKNENYIREHNKNRRDRGSWSTRLPFRLGSGKVRRESGISVVALIPRIAVKNGQDISQFEAELKEQRVPSLEAVQAFPLRMIL
jgi:hypothetical protein